MHLHTTSDCDIAQIFEYTDLWLSDCDIAQIFEYTDVWLRHSRDLWILNYLVNYLAAVSHYQLTFRVMSAVIETGGYSVMGPVIFIHRSWIIHEASIISRDQRQFPHGKIHEINTWRGHTQPSVGKLYICAIFNTIGGRPYSELCNGGNMIGDVAVKKTLPHQTCSCWPAVLAGPWSLPIDSLQRVHTPHVYLQTPAPQ